MTMAVLNYRQNPTDPALFKKNSKKLKKDKKDLDHKLAYLSNEINLEDYLYSQKIMSRTLLHFKMLIGQILTNLLH